jgi:hypothetical protein
MFAVLCCAVLCADASVLPALHTLNPQPTGQADDAVDLHNNFTAAWEAWGW